MQQPPVMHQDDLQYIASGFDATMTTSYFAPNNTDNSTKEVP